MNTCDTCKWWGAKHKYTYGDKRSCTNIVDGESWLDGETLVSPIHDGHFLSDLFTAAKFGCIHHEPK